MRAFLTVLFVLIALPPAGARPHVFTGDSRLNAKQTIRAGSTPLGELMEILKRDTGIEFAAERPHLAARLKTVH